MSKLIVELPDSLHGELKRKAVNAHKTIKEIITELVNNYLSSTPDNRKEKKSTGLCGSWDDERAADEIIEDIKSHRRWFKRQET